MKTKIPKEKKIAIISEETESDFPQLVFELLFICIACGLFLFVFGMIIFQDDIPNAIIFGLSIIILFLILFLAKNLSKTETKKVEKIVTIREIKNGH